MAYKYNVTISGTITDNDSISAQKSLEQALNNLDSPFVLKTINLDQVFLGNQPVEVEFSAKSNEQIIKKFQLEVQEYMDSKAQELNYDSIFTAITYENDSNSKFASEAKAFKAWRSNVWTTCYAILDECLSGTREVPTKEELISLLPELVISYE